MTHVSINRQFGKEDVLHIYKGILLGDRKECNHTICGNLVGCRGHCAKGNKSDIEIQKLCIISVSTQELIHTEKRSVVVVGSRWGHR